MKKYQLIFLAISLLLLSLFPSFLISQESNKGKINIGFEGGVQFTNVDDPTKQNTPSRKTGYSLGPYAEYFISDIVSIKLGFYFDNRGYKIEDLYVGFADSSQIIPDSIVFSRNSYLHITRDYSINYLTIPLSISYIKGSDKFKIYIQAGVYYSLLLNASKKGFDDLYMDPNYAQHYEPPFNVPGHTITDQTGDATSTFNTYDFGMNLNLGFIFQFNPQWGITVSPGFSYSFTNLYFKPEIDAKWSQIYKINAGVVYTLKKK